MGWSGSRVNVQLYSGEEQDRLTSEESEEAREHLYPCFVSNQLLLCGGAESLTREQRGALEDPSLKDSDELMV